LNFLEVQAPEVARLVREAELPDHARRNATRLLAAMASSSERFAPAREKPACLRRAIEVAGASEYLTELLVHHPEDLVNLDSVQPAPPEDAGAKQLEMGLERCAAPEAYPWVAESGLGLREKMALLRRHYRARVLELGTTDLAAGGSAFPMLRRWSVNAGRSIASALVIARSALRPDAVAGEADHCPFVVLGMGRLGLDEFDLASDADLVFVAGSETRRDELGHWTRVAEKTIEVLSSYTREGTLFAVDTRLRPRGQEGELVVTADELIDYVAEHAQAWELLTYLKASPVAGNPQLGQETASRLQTTIFDRLRSYRDFEGELHQMRRRLEREVQVPSSNTKTAPGGYYDVDFVVSYLRLRNRVATLPGANMAEQIVALRAASGISPEDAETLTAGAGFLRAVDHLIRLITGRAPNGLPEHVGRAEAAESVARRWKLNSDGQTLARKLSETQQQVRCVYRRLVGSE
jgi:glutamate-ammonia-ligase adenylyltransferase